MKESPVKIDALLEPLLLRGDGDSADELVLELISVHAEPASFPWCSVTLNCEAFA
jgi:hypothetical protein